LHRDGSQAQHGQGQRHEQQAAHFRKGWKCWAEDSAQLEYSVSTPRIDGDREGERAAPAAVTSGLPYHSGAGRGSDSSQQAPAQSCKAEGTQRSTVMLPDDVCPRLMMFPVACSSAARRQQLQHESEGRPQRSRRTSHANRTSLPARCLALPPPLPSHLLLLLCCLLVVRE
jgi:hypothetical protein